MLGHPEIAIPRADRAERSDCGQRSTLRMKVLHAGIAVSLLLPLLRRVGVPAENLPIARITIKAQDENGKGISKARVDLTFGETGQAATKVTDAKGVCSVEAPSDGYVSAEDLEGRLLLVRYGWIRF